MKKYLAVLLLALIGTILFPSQVFAQNIDPQYIFVRMICIPSYCPFVYHMADPNYDNFAAINEVFDKIGTHGNSNGTRKVGIGVEIHYLGSDINTLKQALTTLLIYSKVHTFPIFISLDGFQWWDAHPELWNWWDSSLPGYNPENKYNVEWTCWDPSCAIQKSWRFWGSESVQRPQPNLASPAFVNADKAALNQLLPIITDWYNNQLSPDKKWLFGGIALGTEVDIGGNYYYYPNGISKGTGLSDSIQLGYAAVKTDGIKSSGQITPSDLDIVVSKYLGELDKTAYDSDIPRNKIFNHVGGKGLAPFMNYPPNVAFESIDATLNEFGQPGWSFYGNVTSQPQNYPDLNNILNRLDNTQWAVPEWYPDTSDYNGWVAALRNTLNYRNNKFINIANWESGVIDHQYVLDAIKTVADESPPCWATSPVINPPAVTANAVNLSWTKGEHNDAVYLNISTNNEFNVDGGFKNVNVDNEDVTNKTSWSKTLASGTYYWQLIADGCGNQRRRVYGSFTIGPLPGDLNHDNKVDILDLRQLLSNFTNIFEYNLVVGNFGLSAQAGKTQ